MNGQLNGYTGVLYGSFIKTKNNDIYIIEYNSRFGDPESVIALELLQTNFYDMIHHFINKSLNQYIVNFSQQAMLAVYLVPKSYPTSNYEKYDIYLDKNTENNIIYGNSSATDDEIANANRDERDSIASLYNSFEDYLQKYEFATDTLIKDGYLLSGFKPAYMKIAQAMKTMFE